MAQEVITILLADDHAVVRNGFRHLPQTQEEVARRFSHELHDELGQSLAAVRAGLTRRSTDDLESLRADCLHLVDESIENVRELSQLLRPVILDDFGLDAGLRWLTEKYAQRAHIELRYESSGTGRYADETETHLYRIAQEALTNIARHSGATAVQVRLEEKAGWIELTVEDNGRGLPEGAGSSSASIGMIGMRARAEQSGGEFVIGRAAAGGGCGGGGAAVKGAAAVLGSPDPDPNRGNSRCPMSVPGRRGGGLCWLNRWPYQHH
jgi:signal transduction histidine kinase